MLTSAELTYVQALKLYVGREQRVINKLDVVPALPSTVPVYVHADYGRWINATNTVVVQVHLEVVWNLKVVVCRSQSARTQRRSMWLPYLQKSRQQERRVLRCTPVLLWQIPQCLQLCRTGFHAAVGCASTASKAPSEFLLFMFANRIDRRSTSATSTGSTTVAANTKPTCTAHPLSCRLQI